MRTLSEICKVYSKNVYTQKEELTNILAELYLIKKNQTFAHRIFFNFLDLDIRIKETEIKLRKVKRAIRDIEQFSLPFGE